MDTQKSEKIDIDSLTPLQSIEVIFNMMNRAATKGVFNIDESYVLKVLFNKVTLELNKSNSSIDKTD